MKGVSLHVDMTAHFSSLVICLSVSVNNIVVGLWCPIIASVYYLLLLQIHCKVFFLDHSIHVTVVLFGSSVSTEFFLMALHSVICRLFLAV